MRRVLCVFVFSFLASVRLASSPFVYVPNFSSDNVSIVDTESNTTIGTIDLGSGIGPYSIAFNPEGTKGYIVCNTDGSVKIIETAENTVVKTITVGVNPSGIAVSPDGESIYVSCTGNDHVYVIDANSEMVVNAVTVGDSPMLLTLSPDGSKLYVPCYDDDIVNVVETSGLTVVATVSTTTGPLGVATTADGAEVWVTCNTAGLVNVIETSGNTVVATVSIGASCKGVSISSDDDPTAYIADPDDFKIVTVDVDTRMWTGPATFVMSQPNGTVLSSDGERLYVTGYDGMDGVLLVFDLSDGSLIAFPPVGADPLYPAITNGSAPPSSSGERAFKRPNNRR